MAKVLDHGYVTLVQTWGSDESIVEAARMSTGKGFLGWGPKEETCDLCGGSGVEHVGADAFNPTGKRPCPKTKQVPGDEKLLRYLYENNHATPFEMAGMTIEVQAPIFVFREWHRHRTQSYNEMSARYMPLPDVNYIPTVDRMMLGGGHLTKQAGTVAGAAALTAEGSQAWREIIDVVYVQLERHYQDMLRAGVPKELARVILPVGRYSRMRASANLRNWLAFLTLRMAPQAQWENPAVRARGRQPRAPVVSEDVRAVRGGQ